MSTFALPLVSKKSLAACGFSTNRPKTASRGGTALPRSDQLAHVCRHGKEVFVPETPDHSRISSSTPFSRPHFPSSSTAPLAPVLSF